MQLPVPHLETGVLRLYDKVLERVRAAREAGDLMDLGQIALHYPGADLVISHQEISS